MDSNNNHNSINDKSISVNNNMNINKNMNINTCMYGEICSKNKMCGDCCADDYDREMSEKFWEKFNIDRKMGEYRK